jgi:hypothetical protein
MFKVIQYIVIFILGILFINRIFNYKDLEIKLKNQSERNQRLLKEFEKRSSELIRAFRSLIGFKVKIFDSKIKLINESRPDDFLLFRVFKIIINYFILFIKKEKNFNSFHLIKKKIF